MDDVERAKHIEEKRKATLVNLEAYYKQLDDLAKAGLNLDVATDIHPELMNYEQRAGQQRQYFWRQLYNGLQQAPRFTIVRRTSLTAPVHDNVLGVLHTVDTWLRVYENLTPDKIVYSRDENGTGIVTIDHPSTLISTGSAGRVAEPSNTLFYGERPKASIFPTDPIETDSEPYFEFAHTIDSLIATARTQPVTGMSGNGEYTDQGVAPAVNNDFISLVIDIINREDAASRQPDTEA